MLTVEFKLNLINVGQGDWLEATSRVIKPSRTLTVCQLDVWRARTAAGMPQPACKR